MAGYVVGSLLMTWILCSALNGAIEYAAINEWINRSKAFIGLLVGVFVVVSVMISMSVWGLPNSTLGQEVMTPAQLNSAVRTACILDVLLVLGYSGFQLRRFWED